MKGNLRGVEALSCIIVQVIPDTHTSVALLMVVTLRRIVACFRTTSLLCLTFHSYITHNTHFQRNSCDVRLALSSVLFRIFRHIFKIAFYPASPKRHRKTEKKHCVVVRMYFSETSETCGNMKGNLHSVEAYHALSFIK